MSEPVNLNRFRKQKARADKKARADVNAAKFGRTKAEKEIEKAKEKQRSRLLDSHKREE